jgi:uncharacterized protein
MGMFDTFKSRKKIDETYFQEQLNQKIRRTGYLKNNIRDGQWIFYYQNGQKWRVEDYIKGKIHGKQLTYYPSGELNGDGQYINGEMEGVFSMYYPNGKLKQTITLKNNKRNGKHTLYDEEGNIVSEIDIINDQTNGKMLEYHSNGQIKKEVEMKDGKENGIYRCYYKSTGQLHSEKTFTNGVLDEGQFDVFNKDGSLRYTLVNKDGKITSNGYFPSESNIDNLLFGFDDLDD